MSSVRVSSPTHFGAGVLLGAAALILTGAVWTGLNLALGISDRAAWVSLLVIGFALCTQGMQLERYGWRNPFNLAGSAVGLVLLLACAGLFFGTSLPFLADDRSAFYTLALLMLLKVALAALRNRFSAQRA